MPIARRRSRRNLIVILLLVISLGLMVVDRRGGLASRARAVSAHVFAPSQSWLKGVALELADRGSTGDARLARDADDVSRLKAMLAKAEADNATLSAKLTDSRQELRRIKQVVTALPDYPLMLVRANVLSREYVLPDGGLKVDGGSGRGIAAGHWVVHRALSEGKAAGVARNQPVIAADGMVGLVEQVGHHVSRVCLVTSPRCRLAARIVHWDGQSGQWIPQPDNGRIQGTGDGRTMELLNIARNVDVCPGDFVVTAKAETGIAEHLIIGEVTEVSYLPTDLTYTILVRPRVDLGALDRVYVLSPRGSPSR